jgi:3-vinyl bacteriochlorophyllide hydratase
VLLEQQIDINTVSYDFASRADAGGGAPPMRAMFDTASARDQPALAQPVSISPNCNFLTPWPNAAQKAWVPPPDFGHRPLYTQEQRARRDASKWTLVQAILAPVQFLVFLVSVGLVARYLATGQGYEIATASIVAKTIILYVIMITGSIWEKVVFDEWLFVESFFWEDVFSMLVLALQTLYLVSLIWGLGTPTEQIAIALAAYATYLVNAGQFVWKLRQARLEGARVANLAAPATAIVGLAS